MGVTDISQSWDSGPFRTLPTNMSRVNRLQGDQKCSSWKWVLASYDCKGKDFLV